MGISRKQSATVSLVALTAIFGILLSACDFVLASNPSSGFPLTQGKPVATTPVQAPASTPDLQPTIDAIVQQRIAEILTPAPPSTTGPTPGPDDAPAPASPTADLTPTSIQFPTLVPVGNFKAEYYRSGFACTGSMRPTIDCGDEGVFLKPPFREPLMVGDVISFSPEEICRHYKNQDISKAHRIVAIRVEGESSYYTTKGDGALDPDACEVTIEQIDGRLVELKKGVRPQDVIDTSEYDLAKERVRHLKSAYEEQRAVYDQLKADYDAQSEEYQQLLSSYQEGRTDYQEVLEFHQGLEDQRIALNQLKDELNAQGEEINAAIDEVDRIYQQLFIH